MEHYQEIQFGTLHIDQTVFDWWQIFKHEWYADDQLEITTWDQFVTIFFYNFESYTHEGHCLDLKKMKQ